MCGIIAITGHQNPAQDALDGLKSLEYRGYDSWGIAHVVEGGLSVQKGTGKISEAVLREDIPHEGVAIGHTRWATHGGVTVENAHPHMSMDGSISVVMNGIIENFLELRTELVEKHNITLKSDTDTEILPHMIALEMRSGADLSQACTAVSRRCHGRFAFVALETATSQIVGLRQGCPLILGRGDDGCIYLASDTPAFLRWTHRVNYLDDGEMALLRPGEPPLVTLVSNGAVLEKRTILLETRLEDISLGDHEHFMIKEILEQKETVRKAIDQDEAELQEIASRIRGARGTFLIGCGTAHKVAEAGAYFFADVASRHINVTVASEFPLFQSFLTQDSLVIAISQSGETLDVIEPLEVAEEHGASILSIVNVPGSSIARMSNFSLHIKAGPEQAVASTKATTSQLAVLMLLAHAAVGRLQEGRRLLSQLSSQIDELLNPRFTEFVESVALELRDETDMFIIGRGANAPMAREAAIKIQEVSYIHAEGFAAGELKHGPIAMISEGTPCIVLVSDDPQSKAEILSNAMEVKARGAKVIGIAPENQEVFDIWIRVPSAGIMSPVVNLIPIQVLSYFLALHKGLDPDKPRNLAKSVTVK